MFLKSCYNILLACHKFNINSQKKTKRTKIVPAEGRLSLLSRASCVFLIVYTIRRTPER